MKKFAYQRKRYQIQAKRKDRKDVWQEWTFADEYKEAEIHANRAQEAGFDARILDMQESPTKEEG